MLRFHRMINFLNVPSEQHQFREDVHRLSSQASVELWAFSTLSDLMVVAVVCRLLHPGDNGFDPICIWKAGCNSTTSVACEECLPVAEIHGMGTFIKVDARRCLGRGKTSTDPSWLAHGGVREGTTKVKLN